MIARPDILFLFCFLFLSTLHAQTDTSEADEPMSAVDSLEKQIEHAPRLTFGLGYMSRVVFQGRDYGVQQYGFSPNLTFTTANGFHFSYEGNVWSGETPNKYARTNLGVGYATELNDHFSVGINYERWILHNGTTADKNALTNYFDGELTYQNDWFALGIAPYYIVGTERAWGLDFSLEHAFEWQQIFSKKDKITFTPNVTAMQGSAYSTATIQAIKPNGKPGKITTVADNTGLRIINYELTLPIGYHQAGSWNLSAGYHYAIPLNPSVDDGILTPFSYFILDFEWLLWRKR